MATPVIVAPVVVDPSSMAPPAPVVVMDPSMGPPPPIVVTPAPGQPWPPGFSPPGAPYGVVVMNGVTYARPTPVRWICFRRDLKLLFFVVIALMAAIAMILVYALTFPATGVLIMAILIAIVLGVEYLGLGQDCSVDPMTNAIQCAKRLV